MDLSTKIPSKYALYDGEDVAYLRLAFANEPFTLPTGKFVQTILPISGKPPAFLLKDVKLQWGWSEKYRTLSIPASPESEPGTLAERMEWLVQRAVSRHAQEWFGKSEQVVSAAVSIKHGIKEFAGAKNLVVKAPSQEEEPEFFDIDGSKTSSDVDLRGSIVDLLIVCAGLFVRGMETFVQWKLLAVAKKTEASKTNDVQRKMASFTLIE